MLRSALTVVVVSMLALPASAYRLVERDGYFLSLAGWVQGGYSLTESQGELNHAPYIGMARLNARAEYTRFGGGFIQIAGESGALILLDAYAYVRPVEGFELRMGKFKVPTSLDFLIRAPSTPFVNRSFVVDLVEKRLLGAELVGAYDFGAVEAKVQLGWFARGELGDPGSLLSARVLFILPVGLKFHAAYLHEVLEPDVAPPALLTGQLDVGVEYSADGWTARAEAVVVTSHDDAELPFAVYGELLYAFDLPEDMAIEPGVHYSVARRDSVLSHRGTVGATWYAFGDFLNASVNYELYVRESKISHAAYLQIQAGF